MSNFVNIYLCSCTSNDQATVSERRISTIHLDRMPSTLDARVKLRKNEQKERAEKTTAYEKPSTFVLNNVGISIKGTSSTIHARLVKFAFCLAKSYSPKKICGVETPEYNKYVRDDTIPYLTIPIFYLPAISRILRVTIFFMRPDE